MFKKFPPLFPFPPKVPDVIVKVLVGGAKKLWNIITDKDSDDIGKRKKMDSDNIADVIDYNSLLNCFLKELESELNIIEDKIIQESTVYYEELISLVESVEESKNIDLNSKYIAKNIHRIKQGMKGSLMKNFYSKFSLDNQELKNILLLDKGKLKEERIQQFKINEIKNGIKSFINELKICLDEISFDITNEINEQLNMISNNCESIQKNLKILEESKNTEEMELVIESAKTKIYLCDAIIQKLGE